VLRLTLEDVGATGKIKVFGRMKIGNDGGVSVTDSDSQEETLLSVKRFVKEKKTWGLVLEALKKYERGRK